MDRFLINLLADESGATAIEYGFFVTLISISAIIALQVYGSSLGSMFQFLAGSIDGAVSPGG